MSPNGQKNMSIFARSNIPCFYEEIQALQQHKMLKDINEGINPVEYLILLRIFIRENKVNFQQNNNKKLKITLNL